MKTIETITALIAENREAWFTLRNTIRADVKALETIYGETRESTPADTIKKLVDAVGYEAAVVAVASLVNRHAWDGRISRRAATWAASIENALDEAAAEKASVYTSRIHMAHLNQLADAMQKFQPETTPTEPDARPENISSTEAQEAPAQEAAPVFTPHSMTTPAGETFACTWHQYAGSVIAEITLPDGKTASITIDQENPHFIPALCAAQEAERIAQAEAAAEKERRREERRAARAADPDKQAHGPVPEKTWIGTKITGLGYTIEFSATYDRTMIIFDSIPTDAARAIVKEAGFFYAPSLGAWVKGLNWKAYRAALKVQETFARAKESPCQPKRRRAA